MNPFIQMVLIYLGVFVLFLFVANIYMKGLLFKYMNARSRKTRGKVLVVVDDKYFSHIAVGTLTEDALKYKTRNKKFTVISLKDVSKKDCVEQLLGALWVRVSEDGKILKRDYSAASGYDGEHFDDLLQRNLNRARLNDYKKQLQIILVAAGFAALLGVVSLVMITQAKKQIIAIVVDQCGWKNLGNATMQYASNVITGGNVV